MISTSAQITNADDVNVTMVTTARLKDYAALADQIRDLPDPAGLLARKIDNLSSKMRSVLHDLDES